MNASIPNLSILVAFALSHNKLNLIRHHHLINQLDTIKINQVVSQLLNTNVSNDYL